MPRLAKDLRFTATEFSDLPDDTFRYEILEGALMMSPAPTAVHQTAVTWLLSRLYLYARKRGAWVSTAPIGVQLDDINVVQPDLVYLGARARKRVLRPSGVVGAPDLVVEVLSSLKPERDRDRKRRVYAAHGVREYWIVDPEAKAVTVFRRVRDPHFARAKVFAETLSSPLLPGLRLDLRDLWAEIAAVAS